MRTLQLSALVLAICCGAFASDDGGRLVFKNSGFSIQALDQPGENSVQILMFLPPSDGFGPNVNVIIQPNFESIQNYVDVSVENSKKSGADMGKATIKGDIATFDFKGNQAGRELHHYARAIFSGGKVWLVTATSLETQWSSVKEKLMVCVDSLKLEK
jgi:hypothetical protein